MGCFRLLWVTGLFVAGFAEAPRPTPPRWLLESLPLYTQVLIQYSISLGQEEPPKRLAFEICESVRSSSWKFQITFLWAPGTCWPVEAKSSFRDVSQSLLGRGSLTLSPTHHATPPLILLKVHQGLPLPSDHSHTPPCGSQGPAWSSPTLTTHPQEL